MFGIRDINVTESSREVGGELFLTLWLLPAKGEEITVVEFFEGFTNFSGVVNCNTVHKCDCVRVSSMNGAIFVTSKPAF
jgi:hypothetical protein